MILACALAMDSLSFNLRAEVDSTVSGISGGNLWDFIEKVYNDYKIIINGIVILIGLFLCFLGKKTVKFNMFVCGCIAGAAPTFAIATDLLSGFENEKQAFWISVGASCLMGIIVGILLTCLFQIGYFAIGAAFGAVLAVYTDVILDSIIHFHSDVVLYVAVGLFALEFGSFALVWDAIVVILGTSVIGSYLIALGLGQFLGNWINPFSPYFPKHIMNPPIEWYIYLGIIAGFSVFGIIVQAITNKDKTAPKEEADGSLPLLSNSTTVETKKPTKSSDVETPKQPEARKQTLREIKKKNN